MNPLEFQAALLKMNLEFLENLSKSLDIAIETMKENNKILEPLMKATDGKTIDHLTRAAKINADGPHNPNRFLRSRLVREINIDEPKL